MAGPSPSLELHNAHSLRDGGHGSRVHFFTNELGTVQLEICEVCSFIKSYCLHEKTAWEADGTVLRCQFCGLDGT